MAVRRWCVALSLLIAACGGGSSPTSGSTSPNLPGPMGDTWTSDGSSWRHINVTGPSPRYLAALAYDAPRHDFLLFGGQTAHGPVGDTWTWDATTSKWTEMSPAHKPPPRRGAAMAYDPEHQVVVLYGGLIPDLGEGHEASDTWIWNGSDWAQAFSGDRGPGPRNDPRMVTAGSQVLMFGGHLFNTAYFGDVWAWNGETWSRVDHGPGPQGRANAAIAWNPDDSDLFVYGGRGLRADAGPGNLGVPLGDAWSLKNGEWHQLPTPARPLAGDGNAIWEKETRRVIVMFGIACAAPTTAAWAWDGSNWSHAQVGVTARWGAAVAQDTLGSVLVYGGSDVPGC